MAGIQELGDDRERMPQVAERRRSAQIDAHGMGQGFAPDRKGVGRQHADAALTAGPREGGAPPRLGQMQPGMRRRLMALNVEAASTSRRMACRRRNSSRWTSMIRIAVPVFQQIGRNQRGERADAPAIDPQRRRDIAQDRAWRDHESIAQAGRDAFRQAADMDGQFGLQGRERWDARDRAAAGRHRPR